MVKDMGVIYAKSYKNKEEIANTMASWNELHKKIRVDEPHPQFLEFAEAYLSPGMRVLDLGCGRGRHAIYLSKQGIEVHAVDSAESGLCDLRKASDCDQLFELLKITQTDISELPFPDDYFDAGVSVNVLQHGYMKDIKRYFTELSRVLRSGAPILIITNGREFIESFIGDETKEPEKNTFLHLKDIPDSDIPHHAFTEDELAHLLSDFEIVRLEPLTEKSQWMDRIVTHILVIAKKK